MKTNLEPATSSTTTTALTNNNNHHDYDDDSNCSTPYVSAPSSPGHRTFLSPPRHPSSFFFYSAPTSPMHYVLSSSAAVNAAVGIKSDASSSESFEFDFSSRVDSPPLAADELFLNGQIRPMKLRAHLSRPDRINEDLIDEEEEENDGVDVYNRCRDRDRDVNKSQGRSSRRTRSMSPMRNTPSFDWINQSNDVLPTTTNQEIDITDIKSSASSSRSSSAGRSSKRWIFLKDLLRSKSEGTSNNKFWQNINLNMSFSSAIKEKEKEKKVLTERKKRKVKGRSAHEMHYAANRAQAEEMRKKTYLPYRQGLLGCLGFNSKSYGAFHAFASSLSST